MSKSARERDNPPPRRKSCSACVRAKRRCEYSAAPACLRCAQRNITCDYPSHRKPQQQQQQHQQRGTSSQRMASMLSNLAEDRSFLDGGAVDVNMGVDGGHGVMDSFEALLNESMVTGGSGIPMAEEGMEKDGFQFALEGVDMTADMGVSLGGEFYGLEQSLTDIEGLGVGGGQDTESDALPNIDFLQPPALATTLAAPMARDLAYVSTMIQQRLEYSIGIFRTAPRTMVHDLETPWSHPMLYRNGMPKSIQDALGSCALYIAKTKVNTPVIFTLIEAHVTELLATPVPTTLPLALAHTHALLLYQIMRLFDGDIAARARGERLITTLENATMHLLSFVRFESELLSVTRHQNGTINNNGQNNQQQQQDPLQPARDLWHDWLLHESARRTVLITFYMLQAYRAMATPHNAGAKCAALCHSWTLSRGLWKAESAVEFAKVWREGRWFVVTNGRFKDALRDVRAEDVDGFGRMWITALMGVDETEWWFAAKGGSLREEMVMGPALVY